MDYLLQGLRLRLRALFNKATVDRELEEELRFHIDAKTKSLVAEGWSPDDARTAALQAFGGVEQRKEECRDTRGVRFVEDLLQDTRYGFRILLKHPGFAVVVTLALALGIGVNTALFSLGRQILLRSLPIPSPQELVIVGADEGRSEPTMEFSYPMYRNLRDQSAAVANLAAEAGVEMNVGYAGQSDKAVGQLVSGNYFETLAVQPFLGRLLVPADDQGSGGHPVAVLSHAYWQSRFGADHSIVGKEIVLNGHPTTLIGITPPGFYGTDLASRPDIQVPMTMATVFRPVPANRLENPRHRWLQIMGRLRPGVSRGQGEAAMDVAFHQLLEDEFRQLPATTSDFEKRKFMARHLRLLDGGQGFARVQHALKDALLLLFAVGAVILLITCANLANMLLARNAAREPEIAMRLALGASRWRLARQWLTETALLTGLGCIAGVLLATWCTWALIAFMPKSYRLNLNGSLDPVTLLFAIGLSAIVGALFGVAPALQVGRLRAKPNEKHSGRFANGFRGSLVSLQVALCLPLLVLATLFLQSLRNIRTVPAGFDDRHVVIASLNPSLNGYPTERVRELYDRLLIEARQLPGVESAAFAIGRVLSGGWDQITVTVEGYQPRDDEDMSPYANTVSAGYFATMRMAMVAGRDFNERDNLGAAKVGIINETMARYFFGNADPIGKRFALSGDSNAPLDIEIVGLVKDAKYVSLKEKPARHFYVPMMQEPRLLDMSLHLRVNGDETRAIELLRAALRRIDPNVPLYDVETLPQQIDESLTRDRLVTWLSTCLGILATLLATIGLYGVIAFAVTRRTREIGIRMALGAQRSDVLALVARQTAAFVLAGIAAGLFLAFAGHRVVAGILYQVDSGSPTAYVTAATVLVGAAVLAAYVPARRALRVQPAIALRSE